MKRLLHLCSLFLFLGVAFAGTPSVSAQNFNSPAESFDQKTAKPNFSSTYEVPIGNTDEIRRRPGDERPLGQTDLRATSAAIIGFILGLLGILCVVGLGAGMAVGIVLLCKKELDTSKTPADERSGKGDASIIPKEIQGGWNWGAAGLGIIWGIYHNVWISFLSFVPILGYVWWIVMGVKGNEWAWRKYKWASVDHFRSTQRKWMPWGIALFAINILFWMLGLAKQLVAFALLGK